MQRCICLAPQFLHRHSFYEFFYILEGHCDQTLGGQQYTLGEGDLCAIPPGVEHSAFFHSGCIAISFKCQAEYMTQIFCLPAFRESHKTIEFFTTQMDGQTSAEVRIYHTGNHERIQRTVLELYEESRGFTEESPPVLYALFLRIWSEIIRHYDASCTKIQTKAQTDHLAWDILRYIQRNAAEASLQQLADQLGYTPEYTSTIVRQLTGSTFTKLRTQARLAHSTYLLSNAGLSVGDIALRCGYQNPESYIRAFKKEYAYTPAAFRAKESSLNRPL